MVRRDSTVFGHGQSAVGKKRDCRQTVTNSLVAPLSDGSPRASRYPCPQFTSDDLAPVHCHGIGFALTGQVTPIHSPALVDLVGRVPGAPPDQPTGSQPSTSSRGLGATCHPWRQGWGHGWRSPCIRRDPRVAGRPRTHGAHGAALLTGWARPRKLASLGVRRIDDDAP